MSRSTVAHRGDVGRARPFLAALLAVGLIGACAAPAVTALPPTTVSPSATPGQGELVVPPQAEPALIQRGSDFSTYSPAQRAAELGIAYSNEVYTNDTTAAIQWPFMVGVEMSSGYGPRWGRLHAGIDLVPGAGAPVQAIADGTVRVATESGGAYGVHVYIDHAIDGQTVTSHYAHMQYNSLRVDAGDTVSVGDTIGLVGNTGRSYGAHLHFELLLNGTPTDPLPWLHANAGRHPH